MAIPAEVLLRTVTYGPETDFQGNSITGTLTFVPSQDIMWFDTGQGFHVRPITVSLNSSGSGSVDLICTDQAGFRDANGATITNWYYEVTAALVGVAGSTKKFLVPTGSGSLDLDTMIPVTSTGGTTVSVPGVINIAGLPGPTITGVSLKSALSLGNVDNTSDANKPVSTAGTAALALKANLASPALTGTPTAPTATAGTNTTQIATTAFVAATTVGARPDILNVKDLGADGVGGNANTAFLTAQTSAKTRKRTAPNSSVYGTTIIDIPSGDYTITALKSILGLESMTGNINGIRFRGAGPGMTNIFFTPTTDNGALVFNDYWQNIGFDGMSFIYTGTGTATFLQSYTTHAAQGYMFRNCSWTGPWTYIMDLQGSNNNSEWLFDRCSTSGMLDTGAFLNIDGALGSDQFLNYWFYNMKHWSTGASIIRAALGGHFHFYGLDVSAYGTSLAAASYLFDLRGNTHAYGVQSLTVEGMRVEAKNALCGLLYSEWSGGNVSIECDWSSQISSYTYGDIINLQFGNTGGPIYNFHDSNLAGGILVAYGSSAPLKAPRVVVRNTTWHQKLTPSEVVTYSEAGASPNFARPGVEFVNCKSDYVDSTDVNGVSVWDALVSNRTPVRPIQKRTLKVGSGTGGLKTASTSPTINLPIGALITAFTAVAPAGAHSETDGGDWALNTTDGSPVTIAAVSVSTSLAAGYIQTATLAVPFLCSTRARATVKVATTNVTTNSFDAFLIIEGYW